MTQKYGLVFKHEGLVWLAEYTEKGLEDAETITDVKGIYDTLGENQLSFVKIVTYQEDVLHIQDLRKITVKDDADPSKGLIDLIREGGLPELALEIRTEVLKDVS